MSMKKTNNELMKKLSTGLQNESDYGYLTIEEVYEDGSIKFKLYDMFTIVLQEYEKEFDLYLDTDDFTCEISWRVISDINILMQNINDNILLIRDFTKK